MKAVTITRAAWAQLEAVAAEDNLPRGVYSVEPPVHLPDGRVQITLDDDIAEALLAVDEDPSRAIDTLVRRPGSVRKQ